MIPLELVLDRDPQLFDPGGRSVFREPGPDRGLRLSFCGLRRVEVGLPGGEIDHVDAAGGHGLGRGRDGQSRGGDDAPGTRGQLHHFTPRKRSVSRVATTGCTKSETDPPSPATSLMMLDVKYAYSSLGMRKTVSTLSSSFRLTMAI